MSFVKNKAEAGAKTLNRVNNHPPTRPMERERERERETHFIVSDKNAVDGQTATRAATRLPCGRRN